MVIPCGSAMAPMPQQLSSCHRVEDHDWRVLALEDVEAILRIGRHRADDPKRLPRGSLGNLDEFVSIVGLCQLASSHSSSSNKFGCEAV